MSIVSTRETPLRYEYLSLLVPSCRTSITTSPYFVTGLFFFEEQHQQRQPCQTVNEYIGVQKQPASCMKPW